MSQCNHGRKEFTCNYQNNSELHGVISKCLVSWGRYSNKLKQNFDVRCFDFRQQLTTYMDYMSAHLVKRRFVSHPYVQWETNRKRNKTNECIWRDESLANRTRDLLMQYEYYEFCDKCMGSGDEITH